MYQIKSNNNLFQQKYLILSNFYLIEIRNRNYLQQITVVCKIHIEEKRKKDPNPSLGLINFS
jgi:hypothetical protein